MQKRRSGSRGSVCREQKLKSLERGRSQISEKERGTCEGSTGNLINLVGEPGELSQSGRCQHALHVPPYPGRYTGDHFLYMCPASRQFPVTTIKCSKTLL